MRCQPIVTILHIYTYILTHTHEHTYPVQATHMSNHTCTWFMICIHTHQRCIHITPLFDIYIYTHTHTHTRIPRTSRQYMCQRIPYRHAVQVSNDSSNMFMTYIHVHRRCCFFDLPCMSHSKYSVRDSTDSVRDSTYSVHYSAYSVRGSTYSVRDSTYSVRNSS